MRPVLMHWPVVRLIALRETRDLLRDRRTVLLILVLPILLYPLFGAAALLFAQTLTEQTAVVGLVGGEHLPAPADDDKAPFPALLDGDQFAADWRPTDQAPDSGPIAIRRLTDDPEAALRTRKVDALLLVPPGFAADLAAGRKPTLTIDARDADEKSKIAARRLTAVVRKWTAKLREARLVRAGLPKDFDQPFELVDPQTKKPKTKVMADELRDAFVKVFPFILMMWLVAGAIQPAVDVTAGEKERGTMETLLISPAERTEIVAGKFLAVTAFSFAAVLWNVVWLTAGAVAVEVRFGFQVVSLPGILGCVALGLPLAMLFSAVCLALGVFARSTKEGQYYLMPLLLCSMPLALWSLMPGQELTTGRALVPVTGAMLLQQKLLSVGGEPIPWAMFGPVLGGLTASVALALALAVRQFRREDVLFRETGAGKPNPFAALFRRQ